MRRRFVAFIVFLSLFAAPVFAFTAPPAPLGYVNDFTGVLSPDAKQNLESELSQFEKNTTNEIAVAIVTDMDGDYIEHYAVKLFENWNIGKKDKDNGVLLIVAVQEHQMRIEVGYGLEGALPDSLAQRILDTEMRPKLRDNDYDGAIIAGVHAIEAATKGEYTPKPQTKILNWLLENGWLIVFGIIFVFQWLAAILGRSKRFWPGGILGLVAGVSIGWMFAFNFPITLITSAFLAAFGLLFDFLVSNAYQNHIGRGSTPPWWAGGGGFGSSSGGFGGFGGGSSGGGGASSSW